MIERSDILVALLSNSGVGRGKSSTSEEGLSCEGIPSNSKTAWGFGLLYFLKRCLSLSLWIRRRGYQSESTVWTEMGCRLIGVDCSWYWENWRSRRVRKMARSWKSNKSRSSRFNGYRTVFLCEQAKFAVLVVIVVFIIPTLFAVSSNYLFGRLTWIFKIVVPIFCKVGLIVKFLSETVTSELRLCSSE